MKAPKSSAVRKRSELTQCPLNDVQADKMLRDSRTAGLVNLHCSIAQPDECLLWAVHVAGLTRDCADASLHPMTVKSPYLPRCSIDAAAAKCHLLSIEAPPATLLGIEKKEHLF